MVVVVVVVVVFLVGGGVLFHGFCYVWGTGTFKSTFI